MTKILKFQRIHTRHTPMFVQNNEVRDIICSTRIRKLFHDIISAIYSM